MGIVSFTKYLSGDCQPAGHCTPPVYSEAGFIDKILIWQLLWTQTQGLKNPRTGDPKTKSLNGCAALHLL